MVDLLSYNGKFLGFTEKQVQQGIRLFEEDCAAKMDKLTEDNVAFKTLELNGSGEFVSNGEMLKMQNDYNQIVETVNKQHVLIEQLNERCNKYYLETVDQRENLAASRKLRKRHEKEIKLLNARLKERNALIELLHQTNLLEKQQAKIRVADLAHSLACAELDKLHS